MWVRNRVQQLTSYTSKAVKKLKMESYPSHQPVAVPKHEISEIIIANIFVLLYIL